MFPLQPPVLATLLALLAAILLAAWLNARRLRQRNAELARLAEARAKDLEAALWEARAADEAKGAFLAVMSHELRTPIHAILGLSELMLEEGLPREQRERLRSVQRAGRGLLALLNDILDFSRLEAGKGSLQSADFELSELVGDLVDLHGVASLEKGLALVLHWEAPERLELRGDPDRLRQVLMNLLGNALKFTAEGHVLLRVETGAPQEGRVPVRFSVADTGPGIALEKQRRIFEPFTQEDTSIARRFGGTGLGLAISRNLAEAMGGRLGFQSEPGRGATFHLEVTLPLVGPWEPAAPQAELTRQRVLLVEPLAVQRTALGALLDRWGVPWVGVDSAQAALEALVAADFRGEGFGLALAAEAAGVDPGALELPTVALVPMHLPLGEASLAGRGFAALLRQPVLPWELRELLMHAAKNGPSGLRLPEAEAPPQPAQAQAGLRALVAEDNPLHRQVVRRLLEGLGVAVTLVSDGAEAVAVASAGDYDVVFLDAQMPGLDGLGAAAALRERGLGAPLVAMTAHALAGDRERFLAAGLAGFLPKPFGRVELAALLSELLPQQTPAPVDEAPVQPTGPGPDPIDRGRLAAEASASPGATRELLALYALHAPGRMAALRRAVRDGDRVEAREAVHALTGSAACIHAEALAAAGRALETRLRGAAPMPGTEDLDDLESAYHAVWEDLERLAAGL